MSKRNGDKSRYGRLRKQKLLRRKRNRKFQQHINATQPTPQARA